MELSPPIFIGFRVKQVQRCPDWLREAGGYTASIEEVCSVSDCVSAPPKDWVDRWDFNGANCYDSQEVALQTAPEDERGFYELFAYRVFSLEFDSGTSQNFEILSEWQQGQETRAPTEPDLVSFLPIGFDIAGGPWTKAGDGTRVAAIGFGCSPLSCNGCAREYPVNRFCLIDDLDCAYRVAEQFAQPDAKCEPPPYYLYQVLRKRSSLWQK